MQIIFKEKEFKDRLTYVISEYFNNDKDLADILKVQSNTVNAWRNQKAIPKVVYLAKIALITGLQLEEFVLGFNLYDREFQVKNYHGRAFLQEERYAFKRKNTKFSFDEQEYKDRLTQILNLYFPSNIEAGKRLGLHRDILWRWKKQTITPPIESLLKISFTLNMTLSYIVLNREPKSYPVWYTFST